MRIPAKDKKLMLHSTPIISLSVLALSTHAAGGKPLNSQEYTPQTVLSYVNPGPEWYQAITMPASAATFQFSTADTPTATAIEAIDLTYFSSSNCTSGILGSGRQTISGGSFPIVNNTAISLNQTSAYDVGNSDGITMGSVMSIAVVFKSSDSADVPQSQFGSPADTNYQCLAVSCSGSTCTGGGGPYSFTMRSAGNQQVLDFADGGVIASVAGAGANLRNLIIEKSDGPSAALSDPIGLCATGNNTDNGLLNTTTLITDCVSTGGLVVECNENLNAPGGYNSDWFVAAFAASGTTASQYRSIWEGVDGTAYALSNSDYASSRSSAFKGNFINGNTGIQNDTATAFDSPRRCARNFTG